MSKYLILIYQDAAAAQPQGETVSANYRNFMEKHGASLRGGVALENPDTATSIRRDDAGDSIVTDGPFAESKEFLAGYWIVDVESVDRAHQIAARVSAAPGKSGVPMSIPIEIRQVMGKPPEDL